jgi:hypothetical protein
MAMTAGPNSVSAASAGVSYRHPIFVAPWTAIVIANTGTRDAH